MEEKVFDTAARGGHVLEAAAVVVPCGGGRDDDNCRRWRKQRGGFVFVSNQSKQWKRKCFKR
jgi:hypothetical protein